jgi:F-type H+-transporting ATPase subunit epsilon
MADGSLQLKVFSGRGLEVEAEVKLVTAPSAVGELGFLPNHCDYVGLLDVGVVEYQPVDGTTPGRFVVTGGLCTFAGNTLKLLADSVDTLESVDRAKYATDRAELEVKKGSMSDLDPEFLLVSQKLARIQAIDLLLSKAGKN